MTCKYPVFAALPESPERQEKGGVQIVVTPYPYECVKDSTTQILAATPTFKERLAASMSFGNERVPTRFIEKRTVPVLRVAPDRLRFKVRIFNQLPRVFRGSGIVLQFIVGGKAQTVDQALYGNLVTAIVPPRSETEIEIFGPQVNVLPDLGTVGVFMYDVVTNTDEAGNVTEKQNYEWYFTYSFQLVEDQGPAQVVRGWVR